MSIHDGFLELAAAAIDFELDTYDGAELGRHLDGCDACKGTAAAFRDDATAIASGTRPRLSPARSDAILLEALRPPRSSPSRRVLAVAAMAVVLGVGLGAAGIEYLRGSRDPGVAVLPSPSTLSAPPPSGAPTKGPTPQPPAATPRAAVFGSSDALPVRGSAQEMGTLIRMVPGPAGDLYVSIPASEGSVLALFDSAGRPRAGWPVVLDRTTSCELVSPVLDGSVRLLCTLANPDGSTFSGVRAYAFDPQGTLLAGWPIDLADHGADGYFAGRVIGDGLTILVWKSLGDQIEAGQPAGNAWILTAAADGTVRAGAKVAYGTDCCSDTWAIGPDGVAYGTINHVGDASAGTTSELAAVGPRGVSARFPVAIDGSASEPAFDAAGRIHVTVGTPFKRPARTLVFDPDGRAVATGSDVLEIAPTSAFLGIEGTGDIPVAPLVSPNGTTFVVDLSGDATAVAGVSPSGRVLAGWPYRSDVGLQGTGFCREGEVCEGTSWASPAIGQDDVLYLLHTAASSSAGGSIVAIGQDGRVVAGWPVSLIRAGSEFWSVVVAPDGTAFVLAVEPEPDGGYSATILGIDPESHVLEKITIVEP